MSANPAGALARGLLAIAGLSLAALVAVALVRPAPRISDPKLPRPWAEVTTRELTARDPSPRPTSASAPRPSVVIEDRSSGRPYNVTLERSLLANARYSAEAHMARVLADAEFRARLPAAPHLEVQLIAYARYAGGGAAPGPWLDPRTGAPCSAEVKGELDGLFVGDRSLPGLLFAVALPSEPLRAGNAALVERVTGVDLSGSVTTGQRGRVRLFPFRAALAHRAELSLYVPIIYGEPEHATLRPEEGASAAFDPWTRIEVAHVAPGRSLSWGSQGAKAFVHVDPSGPTPESRFVAFSVAPAVASPHLEYRIDGTDTWFGLFGAGGLAAATLPTPDTDIALRFFPFGALVRFDLPPLADGQEVDDLFDVRLASFRADDASGLTLQLATLTLSDPGALVSFDGSKLTFPLVRTEVTLGALVEEIAERTGQPLGFDSRRSVFTARRPSIGRSWLESLSGAR